MMTPAAKRGAVGVLVEEHHLPCMRACRIVGLSRSAWYQPTVDWAVRDAPVMAVLNALVAGHTRWGFWKCYRRLRRDSYAWNHKRVHRVYVSMKLNLPRRVKRRLPTRERQPWMVPTVLNRVWALDFMRDTLYDGRPFRTLNVIDEGNREALRIEIGTSIPATRVVRVMNQVVEVYGRPDAIRLDNGPELTADVFVQWAEEQGVELRFIQPGKPNQNALIERFNRSYREEVLNAYLFNTISEVQQLTEHWVADYNTYRPHESLGHLTPTAFLPRTYHQKLSILKLST
jgi:putative transposase